ncbi:hypothetical protein ACFQZJ_13030 [Maribacter chungangensis]|uniref:Phage holin family protein n=1 Tax=Maribacter chungangensis TaxID=1069117 RepID=A0ABW3B746_9FLAO
MGIIDALDETSSAAVEKGEAYVRATKKYYQLKLFQQLAIISTMGTKYAIFGVLGTLGLIFISVAGALALSVYFDNAAIGFMLVGVFFILMLGIAYGNRKRIEKKVIRKLSENYFDS